MQSQEGVGTEFWFSVNLNSIQETPIFNESKEPFSTIDVPDFRAPLLIRLR